jgi:serine/threonine protein kinase/Tol biopolymer transport system component
MASLPPGSRIGPYEVLGVLGAGGMGEVLRARDTSLRRDVALKILPAELAGGEEAGARLAREARVLATLNHPHIAQVYGLETSPAGPAIAMELVAGVTLRDRIQSGVGRAEALRLASQIAMALDAAHEKGIIHRDLKPGNIMVTPDGTAKVLDFGLAKTFAGATVIDHESTHAATVEGTFAGTPAYMSPEQLRGQLLDRRTDIWAFGCILFEMLTRRAPFAGDTMSDLSASILEREPDWRALPQDVAPHVTRLVRRCLVKDRGQRLRDIGDALHELTSPAEALPPVRPPAGRVWLFALIAAGALVVGAGSTWLLVGSRGGASVAATSVQLELSPPPGARFGGTLSNIEASVVAVSPDGQTLAFIASRPGEVPKVWLRTLRDSTARQIAATDNAISLFFSPDGRAIAFFADGQLKRVEVSGGAPVKVCNVPTRIGLSGSWGRQGDILFATVQGERISRVPAAGGTPVDAIGPSADNSARTLWPLHLPDGERFLYTDSAPRKGIVLAEPDGRRTTLVESVSRAQWIEPDWLVYVREGTLVAQRVDLAARRTVGDPVAILGSVAYSEATGWSNVAASSNGTIVAQGYLDERRLAWFDSGGRELSTLGAPAAFFTIRLAPDDTSLLFARLRPELGTYDIWRTDLTRGSEEPMTSAPGMETGEAWVPGGRAIVYAAALRGRAPNLFHKDLVTGAERQLMTAPRFQFPNDVSADGSLVVYQQRTEAGTWDLLAVPIGGSQTPTPLFASAASESGARLAPGGTRMSFTSDESGRTQIYVSPFPVTGVKVQASVAGGTLARWRRDGRELYFISPDRKLMAAAIDAAGLPGPPRVLFDVPRWIDFDVARDGRFIAVVTQVVASEQPLAVIVNWGR